MARENGESRGFAEFRDVCRRLLQEGILSGYLDGELTQAEAQQVDMHLASCAACREEKDGLARLREATMGMNFMEPSQQEWDEHARGIFSSGARGLGWILIIIWAVCLAGFGAYSFLTSDEDWVVKLMVFGFISGFGLLFISVLVDRIQARKTDKYRRVIR